MTHYTEGGSRDDQTGSIRCTWWSYLSTPVGLTQNIIQMVTGQILWKLSVMNKEINSVSNLFKIFLTPYFLIGLTIYACATGLWIYILNKGELSYVYPIQSITFIFAMIADVVIFKENITLTKVLGVTIISLGVIILSWK